MMTIRRTGSHTFLLIKNKNVIVIQKSLFPQYGSVFIGSGLNQDIASAEASNAFTFLLVLGKTPEQIMRTIETLPDNGRGTWIP
jgi:hypothetical protein